MTEVASLVGEFVIPELGSLVAEALGAVLDVVKEMKENEEICRRVYDRMRFVNEELEKITDAETLRQNRVLFMYGTTLANFLKFLKKQSEKSLLKRLASNRKVVEAIQEFHEDMDEIFKLLNLAHMAEMAQWRHDWEEDRKRKYKQMVQILSSTQTIHAEIQHNSASLREAMVMLGFELNHMADKNDKEQLTLMRKTFNKVVSTSNCKVPQIPEWFVSSDDVEFDSKEAFDCGSYGNVYHGTYGKGSKVVIKCLLMDDDGKTSESFFKEVDVWKRLKNPHVIRLYGACHVSNPAFFVCEEAMHGNFADYFEKDSNDQMQHKDQVWRLFYEAACGLYYLHSQKVVHGDLKCNNILVGGDHKAKICDFGFSYIRSQSVGLSAKAQTNTIRWKAPECLAIAEAPPDSKRNPRFASDVFSLGMCIIEAFSGEPPYGIDDDDTILDYIFEERPYPRPEGFEDDEWELVQQMCLHDWENRLSLSAAMDKLKGFAERAKDAQIVTKECAQCSEDMPASSKFCGKCGCPVKSANPAATA